MQRLQIDAVVRWSQALANPTVVFVDDLHWADPLTIDVVARLSAIETISVIITSRPSPSLPLDTLIQLTSGLERVELEELDN